MFLKPYVIVFIVFSGFFMPLNVWAVKKVLILETMPVPVVLESSGLFQTGLRALGFPDEALEFKILNANGDAEIARNLLTEALAEESPDLVVAIATLGSKVAHQVLQDTKIPWAFFIVTDPVAAGIVAEMDKADGGNVTGLVYGASRKTKLAMALRMIEKADIKRPIRLGYIHTDYPSSLADLGMLKDELANFPGFKLATYKIEYLPVPEKLPDLLNEVRQGVAALKGQIDYWWLPVGPLGERDEYVKLLVSETDIPVLMSVNLRGPRNGALLYVGPDLKGQAEEMAEIARQILGGTSPGAIPVSMPKSFAVGINMQTASSLNLKVPMEILGLAGKNIFY